MFILQPTNVLLVYTNKTINLKAKLTLLITILSVQLTISQSYQTIEEVNNACSQLGFAGNEDAEFAVDAILDKIGLKRNFIIQECPEINNAVAKNIDIGSGHKERYILYDSEFFKRIDNNAGNDWAATSILAHEIGHHLNGHALNNKGSNHKWELEADEFSGFVLAKMLASLEEAQSAILTLKYEKATHTHPAKADRLLAIENGYNRGSRENKVVDNNDDVAEIKRIQESEEKLDREYASFKKSYNIETDNFLESGENKKIGLVSKNGNVIIPYEYDSYIQFSKNLFRISKGELDYLLNVQNGRFVLKDLQKIHSLKEGISIIYNEKWESGLINSNGSIVTKKWYYSIKEFKNGYAVATKETGVTYYESGEPILNYCVIDASGNEIIPLEKYTLIGDLSDGLFVAKDYNNKMGYINIKGEILIPFIYGKAYTFENGKALVGKSSRENSRQFYINTSGEKIKN